MAPLLRVPYLQRLLEVVRDGDRLQNVLQLRTDQTVGSSVMKARVVTVFEITWTFFVIPHSFGGENHGGVYRLGHRAEQSGFSPRLPGLMYSQAPVRTQTKVRAGLRGDHALERGRI